MRGLAWHIMGPIAAVAIPLVLLCAAMVWTENHAERVRDDASLVDYARTLTLTIDREFARAAAVGAKLAASRALTRGDRTTFIDELAVAADGLCAGLSETGVAPITVWDESGTRQFHSPGAGAPPEAPPAHVVSALQTGRTVISNLFYPAQHDDPIIAVAVPVPGPGGNDGSAFTGVISVPVLRQRLSTIVAEAELLPGARISVHDRTGITVARSFHDTDTVGMPPFPVVRDAILRNATGLLPSGTPNLEGVPSTIAFAHAPVSGFILKIDVPEALVTRPVQLVLRKTAAIGGLITIAGFLLAWVAARRVVAAFQAVPAAAERGADFAGLPIGTPRVREAHDLASLLAGAFAARARAVGDARALFESSPIGIAIVELDGTVRAANRAFLTLSGTAAMDDVPTGLRWQDLIPAEWVERDMAAIAATFAGDPQRTLSQAFRRQDGSLVPVLVSFGATSPAVALVAVFIVDLTDQQAAETALQETLAQQKLFIERAPASIAMFDRDMRYIAASRRYLTDYRLSEDDPAKLVGRLHYEVFHDIPERWRAIHHRVLGGETCASDEEAFPRAGGEVDWVRWEMTPWRNPDGAVGGALLFSEVITERKRAERALRDSEERLRQIIESSPHGILISRSNGVVELVNRQVEAIFGYNRDDIVGKPLETLVPLRPRTIHRALHGSVTAAPGARITGNGREITGVRSDGTEVPVEIGISFMADDNGPRTLCSIVDITERRRSEEALRKSEDQLRQAQKMEAIGNLTGGMAHDFNNLLSVIIGNLDLVQPLVSDNDCVSSMVDEAIAAALSGAELNGRLLAFARRQPLRPERVAANELVAALVKLLRRTLGEDIQISLDLAADLWPITVDPPQLETALVNLANNARDALPNGGRLLIETKNRHLDSDYALLHAEVTPGDYAMIQVSDTGSGMTPEIAARVFEPFYTTKDVGKGTGLGLSMVFGFIKQSGGHISVYSEPGIGTTFRLYLPRDVAVAAAISDRADEEPMQGEGETVLVVEDNEALGRVVARQVSQLGYHVLSAQSAVQAMELLRKAPVDLLFSDIVMPGGIDGFALAAQVTQSWPDVKIVLTSGFPDTKISGGLRPLQGQVRMLNKPYRRAELARVLRDALGF